ncbi:integrin alpha-PS5 [Bicyclus anynana]|uniref:Integrin alpha-PS5 n=1 Tax=Bicyclus anynana TaxID=110368 RepID=A0A6J1MK95_BICAN|nr:integrin alpha-PS5 [Bicyclus anynana]
MICIAVICVVQVVILPICGFLHEPSILSLTPPTGMEQNSYFGYSMAYEDKTILVGAPAADKFGKVFKFNLAKGTKRDEIISPLKMNGKYVLAKHDWFGATIKNYKPGSFVICAPRKKLPHIQDGQPMEISRGECYIQYIDKSKEPITLADIEEQERIDSSFNYGTDSFGWSVNVDDNHSVWVASPGLAPNVIKIYDETTGLHRTKYLTFNTTSMNNFGYSIINGKMLSDTGHDYAVSTTYGDYGAGKVFIFSKTLIDLRYRILMESTLSGDDVSVGAMYGAALCKANLGDVRDSLLVGAPTFVADFEGFDRGAVYLYVPSDNGDVTQSFTLKRIIKGEKDAGYFGHAIANLGDMDGDMKDEVVISAPFEDEGKGAVYIYSGAGLLENRTWMQRIQSEAKSFGLSLLPLPEYSDNALNGLSVGAPLGNVVYVFKPLPSITITVDTIFPNTKTIRNDTSHIDFEIVVNVVYPRVAKDISTILGVHFQIEHPDVTLDAEKDNILNYNITLDKVERHNKKSKIMTPSDGNYAVPISYILSVDLVDKDNTSYEGRVIRSERSVTSKAGELWVSECKTEVCQPNLIAEFYTKINDTYTVGSSDKEYFSLIVHNSGEPAYNSCALVRVQGVKIVRAPSFCVLDSDEMLCRPMFPLRSNNDWNITNIELGMDSLTIRKKDVNSITIQYEIYNNCSNRAEKITANKSFALHYDYGIHLIGNSAPSEPIEITSSDLENVARLQHHYTIMNNGKLIWTHLKWDLLLENRNYIQYPKNIMIRRGANSTECYFDAKKETKDFRVQCDIGDLLKNDILDVFIDAEILPNLLDETKVIVFSQLTLTLLEGESVTKNITTTLVINRKSVSSWVIIIALLFGLLILLLIGCILYKYNCFERKEKKKLEDLKTQKENREGNELAEGEDVILGVEPHIGSNVDHGGDHNEDHSDAELISH